MEGQKNRNAKWKQRLCNVHFSEEIWQTTKPIKQMHLECTFETMHACKGRRKKKCKMKV